MASRGGPRDALDGEADLERRELKAPDIRLCSGGMVRRPPLPSRCRADRLWLRFLAVRGCPHRPPISRPFRSRPERDLSLLAVAPVNRAFRSCAGWLGGGHPRAAGQQLGVKYRGTGI